MSFFSTTLRTRIITHLSINKKIFYPMNHVSPRSLPLAASLPSGYFYAEGGSLAGWDVAWRHIPLLNASRPTLYKNLNGGMSLPLSNIEIRIAGSRSGKSDRAGLTPRIITDLLQSPLGRGDPGPPLIQAGGLVQGPAEPLEDRLHDV